MKETRWGKKGGHFTVLEPYSTLGKTQLPAAPIVEGEIQPSWCRKSYFCVKRGSEGLTLCVGGRPGEGEDTEHFRLPQKSAMGKEEKRGRGGGR